MPNWKKIITSGSDAALQSLTVSTTITANSFKTPTGTSSQFLMADGSTNSNTYVKTDGTGATGTWGINITGNATTATTLQTARTLTIGATGKTFNGSANVAWTLAEIGAQAALTNPITGTATSGQVAFFNGTTTQTGDTNLFWDNTNKRLGIGTTNPTLKLEVDNTTTGEQCSLGIVADSNPNITNLSSKWYGTVNNSIKFHRGGNSTGGVISIWTTPEGGSLTERMRITSSGYVGIGTTSPSEKLDVSGYVKATGFKTPNGTATQFLMADGSTNSNTYAKTDGTNATGNWSNTSSGLFLNPSVSGKTLNASGQNVSLKDATYGEISGIVQDATDSPLASQWSNRLKTLHYNSQGYFTELAQSFTGVEGVWHRRNVAGTISSWKQLYDDSIWNAASLSYSGSTLTLTINGISKTATINAGTTYNLPIASASVLGGVKIGSGISIDGNGVISVSNGIAGTVNYIPKFTASGTIGNSLIYDNGTSVGIGTTTPSSYKLNVNGDTNINGTLTATVKSFIIDHPTKPNKKLQYGVLEGPEHSVYFRGKLTNSRIITLPDHWHALVHEDTITVNLTPIGKKQDLWVETVSDTTITVGSDSDINCFYTVFAERKDIEKLVTEFDK